MASLNPGDICPKCGEPISWIEAYTNKRTGKKYYYAIHYQGKYRKTPRGVKPIVKKCYLGPGEYTYVTRQHNREGLKLKGMNDADRLLDYIRVILSQLDSIRLTDSQRDTLVSLLEEALKKLREG